MLGTSDNTKILWAVVCPIFVGMVDMLGRLQWSAKHLLHHSSVFSFAVSTVPNASIPFFVNPPFGVFYSITTSSGWVNCIRTAVVVVSHVVHLTHSKCEEWFATARYCTCFHDDMMSEQSGKVK